MKFVLMNDNLDNWSNKNLNIVRRGVSFNKADLDVVRNCIALNNEEILQRFFDIIGIKYTAIHPKYLAYEVNGEMLTLADLSSGERDYLYALCCKYSNTPFILIGTLERFDLNHRKSFLNELIDYENGYVVTMNRMIVGKDNLHLYVEV